MDAVCILFRKKLKPIKPDFEKQFLQSSWEESLKVMSDTSFLRKIVDYPTDIINAEMVDLLVPYFNYKCVPLLLPYSLPIESIISLSQQHLHI